MSHPRNPRFEAELNRDRFTGIAPDATIYSYKVFGAVSMPQAAPESFSSAEQPNRLVEEPLTTSLTPSPWHTTKVAISSQRALVAALVGPTMR